MKRHSPEAVPTAEAAALAEAQREIARLRRALTLKERDSILLTSLYGHSQRLCQAYERRRSLRLLHNRLILHHTPNLVYVLDEELRLLLSSRSGALLTAGDPESLFLKPLRLIFSPQIAATWVEKLERQCREIMQTRYSLKYNDTLALNGEQLAMQVNLKPVIDDNEIIHGLIIFLFNITELMEAKMRAEEGAKAKSSFLANMSHEIRTPLNSIKGFSELLRRTELSERQNAYLERALTAANALIGIIDDILDYSKIDAGKMEIVAAPYRTDRLLAEVCQTADLSAEKKGLTFLVNVDCDLPLILVGDQARLKQIIVNLLSNAVKYTPRGYIKLSLRAETREDDCLLTIVVEDSGLGIKPQEASQLFGAFTRIDLQTNRHIAGAGLGLAISRRLAQAMGGDIFLRSRYGKGSAFTLEVPQTVADPRPLCRLNDPGRYRVVVLGNDARLDNAAFMLASLGVFFYKIKKAPEIGDAEAALARLQSALPSGELFTHCLYADSLPEGRLALWRSVLPAGCRFAELHSPLHIPVDSNARRIGDLLLFNPLLISDLVGFFESDQGEQEREDDHSRRVSFVARDVWALAVDDHEMNLLVCEEFLREYGIEVVRANSGAEALRLCQERTFDIIFLDHMMPQMDGAETARRLRSGTTRNRLVPLIALTADVVDNMRDYYLQNGFDEMIGKPIDQIMLNRTLLRFLPPYKIEKLY